MNPILLENEIKRVHGFTLHRLFWPDRDVKQGWATKDCTFASNTSHHLHIGEAACLFGGRFHGGNILAGHFYGGRFYDGTYKGGTFEGGNFLDGRFYGGVFKGGSFYGGAFNDGVFKGGTFHGGTFHEGVFEDGAFKAGDFYKGVYRESPILAQRSDGHTFIAHPIDGKMRIFAGCRNFSWKKAKKHWGNPRHLHHTETMRILKFLCKEFKHKYPLLP